MTKVATTNGTMSVREFLEDTYRPASEPREDLAQDFLAQQEKIQQARGKKEAKQFILLLACIVLTSLVIPPIVLAAQHAIEAKQCEQHPFACQQ